jgi:TIGR00341 family protein
MSLLQFLKNFLSERFSLNEDRAEEAVIIEGIRKEVSFKGTNVWTLIFAIFIASIGLNVNSTAVIIGAMLISPLMGPIMGAGLSIGINDLGLLKKSAKNLFIAASISIATSFLYFSISPLHEASSELLARTMPTIWDVFIAFFGGLAGIVAGTRKEKSNVIPGVAIATALMPPLCTAGFGLAIGNIYYFLGAIYLFLINSLFICLAAFIIVKRLRFRKVAFSSPEREKRVSRYFVIIAVLTVLPSIYLAYQLVQKSIFEANANNFIESEFRFAKTQVVTRKYQYVSGQKSIELLLVGQHVPESFVDSLKKRMPAYKLSNTNLTVHQGLDAKQKIDIAAIKASVMADLYVHENDSAAAKTQQETATPDLKNELLALYPQLKHYSIGDMVVVHTDSTKNDTLTVFTGNFDKPISKTEKNKLALWLSKRINVDSVKVLVE